jgi:hypothetical protein
MERGAVSLRAREAVLRQRVETAAKKRLAEEHPHGFYFGQVECVFEDGVLRLRGRVPTYYMKQLLQNRLADIDGVDWIDNEVDVVSSVGLSSARPR